MWLDTFNEMRKKSGMSLDEISEKSGVPKGTLAKITSGITKAPALETMKSLVYAMGYTLKDLDDGLEESDGFSTEEKAHIKKYRLLDLEWQEAVDSVLDIGYRQYEKRLEEERAVTILRERSEAAEEIAPDASEMLVYINPAAAGTPLYAESDFERLTFPSDKVPRGTDFGIRISGKSMEPTVMDGSIAWVRKRLDMPNGTVGIFMLNDSAVCKRFFKEPDGTVRLESDNPGFGPAIVAEFDTLVTVGEVIGTV